MRVTSANKYGASELTQSNFYISTTKQYRRLLLVGIVFVVGMILISLTHGNYNASPADLIESLLFPTESDRNYQIYTIVIYSRLPRVLAAMTVGAALSLSGLVYQSTFDNRMVSPDILGVSAGAGVGAAVGFLAGFGTAMISVSAFASGLLAVCLTMIVSSLFGENTQRTLSLVLSGVVVSGLMNSMIGLIKYTATNNQLASITYWLLGGLNDVSYSDLVVVVPIVCITTTVLLLMRWQVSMLARGEDDARTHGVNYRTTRNLVILCSTLMTAASVSISGSIGWIGLVIPNLIRLLVGDSGKYLMPLTIIYGMIFTMIADLMARTMSNAEIPIGIITGIIGTAAFVVILVIRRWKA